jgi:hypothetical protein
MDEEVPGGGGDSRDRAGWSAAWGVAALVPGSVAAVFLAGHQHGFPVWPVILVALTLGALYLCFAALRGWWPFGRHRRLRNRDNPPANSSVPTREVDDKASEQLDPSTYFSSGPDQQDADEPPGPHALVNPDPPKVSLSLVDDVWDLWENRAWIVSVEIRITNLSDKVLRLIDFGLESSPDLGSGPKLTQTVREALIREAERRRGSKQCFERMELAPGESATGWWVGYTHLPFPEWAGRPPYRFIAIDAVGDSYTLEFPARTPKLHRQLSTTEDPG